MSPASALLLFLTQVPKAGVSTSIDGLMANGGLREADFDRAFGHSLRKGYIAVSSPGWIHRLPAGDAALK